MNTQCRKVRALMSLYIDDALSDKLKMFVYNHLQTCKPCMEFYLNMKKTMEKVRRNFQQLADKVCEKKLFDVIEYENFRQNTSAFFDGELTGTATLQFKNCLENSDAAKKYFNSAISVNKALKTFIKEKSPVLEHDFSKEIVLNMKKENQFKNIDFSQTVITLILGFFIITGLWLAEKMIFNNYDLVEFQKISSIRPKLKSEIFKIIQPAQKK